VTSRRRNFTRACKVEILKRSMINGIPTCEQMTSGVRCACQKGLDVHHLEMDAMIVDKSRVLTAADGVVLCKAHHDPITKDQKAVLKKTLAVEAAHLGAKKDKAKIAQPPKPERPTSKLDSQRALGRPGLGRQFVSIGEVANAVMARIKPRKDAAE
jgi:hypothetical protein